MHRKHWPIWNVKFMHLKVHTWKTLNFTETLFVDGIVIWHRIKRQIQKPINEIESSKRPNVYFRNHRLHRWPRLVNWLIKMKINQIETVNQMQRTKTQVIIQSSDQYRTITIHGMKIIWAIKNRLVKIKIAVRDNQRIFRSIFAMISFEFLFQIDHQRHYWSIPNQKIRRHRIAMPNTRQVAAQRRKAVETKRFDIVKIDVKFAFPCPQMNHFKFFAISTVFSHQFSLSRIFFN